jgi:hypothetical protein
MNPMVACSAVSWICMLQVLFLEHYVKLVLFSEFSHGLRACRSNLIFYLIISVFANNNGLEKNVYYNQMKWLYVSDMVAHS